MASFLPPVVFEIKAMANEAIAKFGEVDKELKKMGKDADAAGGKIGGMEKASKIATAGLLALGTAFVGFAAMGIKEALGAEVVMTKLGQTMSNVGVNTEENRKHVEALASSYVKLGFADEDAAAGFDVLLRATGDMTKAQDLLSLSADFARVNHMNMADASKVLAKAQAGNLKAFKEMNITLDSTLPKSEAIAKAFDQLKDKIGGQALAYTHTFAGQMAVMKAEFEETAQQLGNYLLPLLVKVLDAIKNGVKFVSDHATAFKIFGGILLTVVTALAAYNAVVKVQMALTKAWTVVTTIQKTVMALLTGQQLALNTAMELNPIGLIAVAVVALIALLFTLWNHFEGFRKAVIAVGKAGLTAFAAFIPMLGTVAEAILKFLLTPFKTFLSALSHLPGVGKYAKAGLDLLNKGLDGVSDFADKASDKAKSLAKNLDKLNKPIKFNLVKAGSISDNPNSTTGGGGKGGGVPPEVKKANEGYMKTIKDLQDKVSKAKTTFDESMAKAEKNYQDDVTKINADFADKKLSIEADYSDAVMKLNAKRDDDLVKLAEDNQKKVADITASGQKKLEDIVMQSVNRLRDAYKKGTEFSVGDIFKGLADAGTQSAEGLLDALKSRLTAAKDLAANAAYLQAQGFSQTFIEQIVSAGPEMGNQMTDALKKASPETIKELQSTYLDLEKTADTGVNAIAQQMNAGGKLATDELNVMYAQAQADTRNMLAEQALSFSNAQAEIHKTFSTGMAEAASTRDKALAEATKVMNEQLAAANTALAEAQASARKQLSDDLAAIQKDFDDKLGGINNTIASTISAIAALKAAMASASSSASVTPVIGSPVGSGFVPTITSTSTVKPGDKGFIGPVINTTVNASTNASPAAIATSVTNAIKYGTTVTAPSVNTAQGVSNKLKAMGNMAFE